MPQTETDMKTTRAKATAETRTLHAMLGIYCRGKHGSEGPLCSECMAMLIYAIVRLKKCPFGEEKPTCNQCTVHCYKPAMRAQIREVMKYSGPRMLTAHPVLAAKHLLQGLLRKPRKKDSASG
jgi:hypothetical protein